MRRHVETLLRRMNEHALEAKFNSFSEMSLHVDASDFTREPMRGLRSLFDRGHRCIDRTQMTIHQRTTLPLSPNSALTLGGYMFDKQGLGVGAFTCQLQYSSPDPSVPSVTVSSEVGWTPKISCQISQPVSKYTVFTLIPELDDTGFDISMGVNRVLSSHLQGGMMWSTRDGIQATLSSDTQTYRAMSAVAIRKDGPSVSGQYRQQITSATTGKIAVRGGLLSGISLSLGGSTEFSERSRVGMGVLVEKAGISLRLAYVFRSLFFFFFCDCTNGTEMRSERTFFLTRVSVSVCRFTRGSVRFVIPILISPFSAETAWGTFWAATTPFFVSALVSQLIKPEQERIRKR
jgi:DnaJ family protein C protein 11